MTEHWLDRLVNTLANAAPPNSFWAYGFNIRALLALILVSIACGWKQKLFATPLCPAAVC